MLVITWQGKAVSENKRLIYNPKAKRMVGNPVYQAFVNDLAWTIKSQAKPLTDNVKVNVTLDVCLWGRMDSDNVQKPCLDALQRSGIIKNDNLIREPKFGKREVHKRGDIDQIVFKIEEAGEI